MPLAMAHAGTDRMRRTPARRVLAVVLGGGGLALLADPVSAQQPYPDPYVQAPPPAETAPQPSIRQLFASTLAAVATAGGSALAVGLTQAITGGLTNWFNRKLKVEPPAPGHPGGAQPAYGPGYPSSGHSVAAQAEPGQPEHPGQTPYPAPQPDPPPGDRAAGNDHPLQPPYPTEPGGAVQYYDSYTGAPAAPDPALGAAGGSGLYAGLAFEVHALQSGGATFAVDPSSYEFRTGDRFVVYYRPTLPGRLDVYNINPAGRQSLIDSLQIAAGQLAQLGPYEFIALTGTERLRLVLQPCTTPMLTAMTRDIAKVAQQSAEPGLDLADCGPATRSARASRTRDIRKVALEGSTGFALDPVSEVERASGRLDAREVTIVFRHR